MKASPKKLLPLTLIGIAVTSLVCVRPAQAYTVTLHQMGSNVVWTGRRAINLTRLNLIGAGITNGSGVIPLNGLIYMVPGNADVYTGFTGPTSFGVGGNTIASSFSGDVFADIFGILFLPVGYVSGNAISDSMTFNNATFASLGVTPGTYVWRWGTGSGLPNQNVTLIIGRAGVPDGGTTVSLLGFALLGLAALRRTFSC